MFSSQYYATREMLEKDLQVRLDEIRAVARRLAAAKESYKDAFSRIDVLASELEQKRHLKGLKNGDTWEDDFSQFQEIEDIGKQICCFSHHQFIDPMRNL